jgi:hypothetical protein
MASGLGETERRFCMGGIRDEGEKSCSIRGDRDGALLCWAFWGCRVHCLSGLDSPSSSCCYCGMHGRTVMVPRRPFFFFAACHLAKRACRLLVAPFAGQLFFCSEAHCGLRRIISIRTVLPPAPRVASKSGSSRHNPFFFLLLTLTASYSTRNAGMSDIIDFFSFSSGSQQVGETTHSQQT